MYPKNRNWLADIYDCHEVNFGYTDSMAVMRSLVLSLLVFGHQALSDAACCVNSPERRDCWKKGIDIYSDPDFVIPEGRLREVSIHHVFIIVFPLSLSAYSPDGICFWVSRRMYIDHCSTNSLLPMN
jgi:hypothetical protein